MWPLQKKPTGCFTFFLLFLTQPVLSEAKSFYFSQAPDTFIKYEPLGHLMDLNGSWSLMGTLNSNVKSENATAATAVAHLPLSSSPEHWLHGFYLSPTYTHTQGQINSDLSFAGQNSWSLAVGRGNFNFPKSTFRGFVQIGYRESSTAKDDKTKSLLNALNLDSKSEGKKSVLIVAGASSTQRNLVAQKKPFFDSELILQLRYDHERGDFSSFVKGGLLYPWYLDFGAHAGWFKAFRNSKELLFNEVSDDFIFGPKIRGRAWESLAFDFSVDWHAYKNSSNIYTIPPPRGSLTLIATF